MVYHTQRQKSKSFSGRFHKLHPGETTDDRQERSEKYENIVAPRLKLHRRRQKAKSQQSAIVSYPP